MPCSAPAARQGSCWEALLRGDPICVGARRLGRMSSRLLQDLGEEGGPGIEGDIPVCRGHPCRNGRGSRRRARRRADPPRRRDGPGNAVTFVSTGCTPSSMTGPCARSARCRAAQPLGIDRRRAIDEDLLGRREVLEELAAQIGRCAGTSSCRRRRHRRGRRAGTCASRDASADPRHTSRRSRPSTIAVLPGSPMPSKPWPRAVMRFSRPTIVPTQKAERFGTKPSLNEAHLAAVADALENPARGGASVRRRAPRCRLAPGAGARSSAISLIRAPLHGDAELLPSRSHRLETACGTRSRRRSPASSPGGPRRSRLRAAIKPRWLGVLTPAPKRARGPRDRPRRRRTGSVHSLAASPRAAWRA